MMLISDPTIKNFYDNTDGDSGKTIKYKEGVKFSGHRKGKDVTEIIPFEILKNDTFRVDCHGYFKLNKRYAGEDKKIFLCKIIAASLC